jgi:hypothetical protein
MSIDVARVFREVLDGKWVGVGAIKRGGTYLGPRSCWLALPALVFVLPGPRQPCWRQLALPALPASAFVLPSPQLCWLALVRAGFVWALFGLVRALPCSRASSFVRVCTRPFVRVLVLLLPLLWPPPLLLLPLPPFHPLPSVHPRSRSPLPSAFVHSPPSSCSCPSCIRVPAPAHTRPPACSFVLIPARSCFFTPTRLRWSCCSRSVASFVPTHLCARSPWSLVFMLHGPAGSRSHCTLSVCVCITYIVSICRIVMELTFKT